jgi:P27 family predicted phage terminase small subunit
MTHQPKSLANPVAAQWIPNANHVATQRLWRCAPTELRTYQVAPPRRPTHLKILAGEREDRINRNAPLPTESTVSPPVELSDGAREVWNRLARDLEDKGCLTSWDVDLFAVYCDAAATYYECRRAIGSDYTVKGSVKHTTVKSPLWRIMKDAADTMRTIGARFGLTPSDRAGIDVSDTKPTPQYGPERLLG